MKRVSADRWPDCQCQRSGRACGAIDFAAATSNTMEVGQITSVQFYGNEKFAIGKIMQGGMGRVYQLFPIRANAPPVALKTLQSVMSVRDFERECNAWLSVAKHKNIARAGAFGKWAGLPAIIVDWYPKSMEELKAEECSDDHLIEPARGIISALDFAYRSSNLIHQDIKPANILVDEYGAARLSDFGLARCVKTFDSSATPHNWQETTSLALVPGATSGTPFYMAPELFSGACPSIKTDLFSFGVTFFNFLTREHPYFGPDTNGRYSSRLRYDALAKIISKRSARLASLVELLCTCLSFDPDKRPVSYQATGWLKAQSSFHSNSKLKALSEITAAVDQAKFFRERGKFTKAEAVLREQIKAHPKSPILLNAIGILFVKLGRTKEAIFSFSSAFELLRETAGTLHGSLYYDPPVNLARQLLDLRRYDEVYVILQTLWEWSEARRDPTASNEPRFSALHRWAPDADGWYCEFGWMLLYAGDFIRATDYLAKSMSKKGHDQTTAYWLTESSWFGNRVEEHAEFLIRNLIQFADSDLTAALCGCLAAQFAASPLAREMIEAIPADRRRDISSAEREVGLGSGVLLYPKSPAAQRLIIRSLDDFITGGKHYELVR